MDFPTLLAYKKSPKISFNGQKTNKMIKKKLKEDFLRNPKVTVLNIWRFLKASPNILGVVEVAYSTVWSDI